MAALKEKGGPAVLRRRLADGTRVYLIYGRDQDAIRQAITTFTLK